MIKRSIEDIIRAQPAPNGSPRKWNLSRTAVGSALAISITMFMLKYDIMKNHFELSNRIERVERRLEEPYMPASVPIVSLPYDNVQHTVPAATAEQTAAPSISEPYENIHHTDLAAMREPAAPEPAASDPQTAPPVTYTQPERSERPQEFVIIKPCYDRTDENIYEVRACTTTRTAN